MKCQQFLYTIFNIYEQNCWHFNMHEQEKQTIMLSLAEHEKSFITSEPGFDVWNEERTGPEVIKLFHAQLR